MITDKYQIISRISFNRDAHYFGKLGGLHSIGLYLTLVLTLIISMNGCAGKFGDDLQRKTADIYYEKKEYKKAEKEYIQILQKRSNDSEAQFRLGVINHRQGKINQSIIMFLKVIAIDPEHSKSFYNLAAIHANKGPYYDKKKAVLYFKEYLKLEPGSIHRKEIEKWLSEIMQE